MTAIKEYYPMSPVWDHERSINDLLENHKTVYMNMDCKGHKSDDGYGGIRMFIPHDEQEGFTEIGVDGNGFVYDGDAYFPNNDILTFNEYDSSVYEIETKKAINIMIHWKDLMNVASELQSILAGCKNVNHDCIIVKCVTGYDAYVKPVTRRG
jgi:hypothetical protein